MKCLPCDERENPGSLNSAVPGPRSVLCKYLDGSKGRSVCPLSHSHSFVLLHNFVFIVTLLQRSPCPLLPTSPQPRPPSVYLSPRCGGLCPWVMHACSLAKGSEEVVDSRSGHKHHLLIRRQEATPHPISSGPSRIPTPASSVQFLASRGSWSRWGGCPR